MFWDIHPRSRLPLDKWCSGLFLRVGNTELVTEETLVSPRPGWTKSNLCNYMFSLYSAVSVFYLSQLQPQGAEGDTAQAEWDGGQICNVFPFFSVMTVHCKQIIFLKQRCNTINFWMVKEFWRLSFGKTNAGANDLCRWLYYLKQLVC